MTLGLFLLSRLPIDATMLRIEGTLLLLGLGMGLVMQVLVIAVQNAVEYRDLGVATSGNTLFRSVGGSVGTAVLGAIFTAQLAANLARQLPAGSGAPAHGGGMSLQAIAQMPPAARAVYAQAFTNAIDTVFLVGAVIALVGFAVIWLLPESQLRETVEAASADVGQEVGGAMAIPRAPESYEELARGLAAVVNRDVRRKHIEEIATRAGVGLGAAAAWLLMRLDQQRDLSLDALARQAPYRKEELDQAADELRERGLLELPDDGARPWHITAAGCDALNRIVAARRAHIEEVFGQWSAEEREDLAKLVHRLTRELVPDARSVA
jgi:DNA-binding MarR family transcriptional regulator